ncbi:MAG TPA: protein kinase, partial [Burkholderiaceae bacterium]|nr:protein kinase [Burkholderiaceae bacterium]
MAFASTAASADASEADHFDLSGALTFFLALVAQLLRAHQADGAHLALCPFNIDVNDEDLPSLMKEVSAPVAYMSPEQSGRMNRRVDQRSDYYSLGVIFYELLTGRLPFESDSPMEVVYSHIAKLPIDPIKINPTLPPAVSDIVLKLLSKNAEDRYQSLKGLAADLQRCLNALSKGHSIERFKLGEHDVSERLQIPQKLYGREGELGQLIGAFNRIANGGT